ncbi:MAG: carboxypeptidase-like regulatory domain-containing protein [Candidatus Caldatribacteriaceae bacterium]
MKVRYFSLLIIVGFVLVPVFSSLAANEEKAILKGRALLPVITKEGKITEKFFSLAPVKILDLRTGETVAETTTQIDGKYSLLVDPPGPYLLEIGAGNRTIMDISPKLRRGETQDLSFAGSRSTALALVLLRLISGKKDPTSTITYRTSGILRQERFLSLESLVKQSLAQGRALKENLKVQKLIEEIATTLGK